jgi:hypothetical protein
MAATAAKRWLAASLIVDYRNAIKGLLPPCKITLLRPTSIIDDAVKAKI